MTKTLEERAAEVISLDEENHYLFDKEALIEIIADQQARIRELETTIEHIVNITEAQPADYIKDHEFCISLVKLVMAEARKTSSGLLPNPVYCLTPKVSKTKEDMYSIHAAPRDGTPILGYRSDTDRYAVVYWNDWWRLAEIDEDINWDPSHFCYL